ncbi:hypothetical protein HA402_009143 [Bradysia odoriphaga]|nr:hypothetical protein HA402_009143 [Bradysia odoriphaga]
MSAAEVNRIFDAIESQYEVDGTIDPQQKAMLFMEMKKFNGGEKFVQQISAAFQQIENNCNGEMGEIAPICSLSSDNNAPKAMGTVVTSRRNKLKFNLALKVFRLFQFSCNIETSPIED